MGRPSCIISEPLRSERLDDGRRLILRDIGYQTRGHTIWVPAGYKTDFASLPVGSRNIVRFDRVDLAGVVHDWLFESQIIHSLWEVNLIFHDVALSGDPSANHFQGALLWSGLTAGSWYPWRKYKNGKETQPMAPLIDAVHDRTVIGPY